MASLPSVVPYLVIRGASQAIAFYEKAFGARERMRMPWADGKVGHAELEIGDGLIYLGDECPQGISSSPQQLGGTPVSIHLNVADVDAVFNSAVAAGATVVRPLANMFWGDRFGVVKDPFGHVWGLSTHVEDVPPDEMARRAAEAMKEFAAT